MTSTRLSCPNPSPPNPPRSLPPWPNTLPSTSCELSTISLNVAEGSPFNHRVRKTLTPVSRGRFGTPSNNPFFCRKHPHSQRVHRIKGIDERPLCAVNDVIFSQMPQYCLGRVMTPRKTLVLQCNTPISVTSSLPTCPLMSSLACNSSLSERLIGSPRGYILQMDSIGEIQQWMLTAGHREKDQIFLLLRASLAKESFFHHDIPDIKDWTVIHVENRCLDSRLASISEEDESRHQHSNMMSDSSTIESAESEGSKTKSSRERQKVGPRRTFRLLGSPSVHHLNQKVVLRYTKRSP